MMKKFSITCTCGHKMTVDAETKEEAIVKLNDMMTQEALDDHFLKNHQPTEQKPTLEQAHAMITQTVQEDVEAPAPATPIM